jgi:hypothetical protein
VQSRDLRWWRRPLHGGEFRDVNVRKNSGVEVLDLLHLSGRALLYLMLSGGFDE